MTAAPGGSSMLSVVTSSIKALSAKSGDPNVMLGWLAAEIVNRGTCAFAGQEAVFVLNGDKNWEEYHAVYFNDGITGIWIENGKYVANWKAEQTVPPPTSDTCGEPVPPPLTDFSLHCGRTWCDATPSVHGCDFCAAIGLGEMPGQPGVQRCDCPAGNEDDPVKRQACELQVLGGAAFWRSDSGVEINQNNHLQARCSSPCTWIEVCKNDGTKCTRVGQ
jgi:hypothetical protein